MFILCTQVIESSKHYAYQRSDILGFFLLVPGMAKGDYGVPTANRKSLVVNLRLILCRAGFSFYTMNRLCWLL